MSSESNECDGCVGCWFYEVSEEVGGYCRRDGECIWIVNGKWMGVHNAVDAFDKRMKVKEDRVVNEGKMGLVVIGLCAFVKCVCVVGLLKFLVLGGLVVFVFVGVDLLLDG
jgi:hypothetical protein